MRQRAASYNATALAILDGSDPRTLPRLSDMAMKSPDIRRVESATQQYYDGIARKQQAWLQQHQAPIAQP